MVSKARLDLPEPLGPVTTVNFPSGRSTSMPLRLFWRAPRISMQSVALSAMVRFLSAIFEPTGDYPRSERSSQMTRASRRVSSRIPRRRDEGSPECLFKPCGNFFALLHQLVRHNAAERVEKLFVLGQLRFPIFVIDFEQFVDAF